MSLTKKVLTVITAGIFTLALNNSSAYGGEIPEYLQEYSQKTGIPIREKDYLSLNPESKSITVTQISCEEGYLQARELARKRFIENVWVCLPSKDLWIGLGKNKKRDKQVIGRGDLLDEIISNEQNIKLVHIHLSHERKYILPTLNVDLRSFSRMSSRVLSKKLGKEISFPIINIYGVLEFSFKKRLPDHKVFKNYDFPIVGNPENDSENISEKGLMRLIERVNKEGFLEMTYTPFE